MWICWCYQCVLRCIFVFFFKQKTAYEMRISDWSSDVCSSDLDRVGELLCRRQHRAQRAPRQLAMAHFAAARRAEAADLAHRIGREVVEIGRASCRERVCQYV